MIAASDGVLGWLQATPLAAAMRHSLWLYPIVEIVHIVGIATLVGTVLAFDLRIFGVSRQLPITALAGHLLPWSRGAFVLVLASGAMMFSAHATDFFVNPVFRLKIILIVIAFINVVLFHARIFRTVADWNVCSVAPGPAMLAAAVSLCCWLAVICCGRLLAYT